MEYECSNGSRMIIARSRCSIDNKRTEEWIGSNSRAGRRRLSKNFDDESVNNTAVFWMRTPLVTAAPLSRNRGLRTNAYTCVRVQHAPITRLITPDHLLAALVRQNIMLASLSLSLSLSLSPGEIPRFRAPPPPSNSSAASSRSILEFLPLSISFSRFLLADGHLAFLERKGARRENRTGSPDRTKREGKGTKRERERERERARGKTKVRGIRGREREARRESKAKN